MAVNQLDDHTLDGHPLPCGRLVEDVFDDLEAGRTDIHGRTCEHCITAGRSLAALQEATRALVEDPTEPSPGLLDRIMQAVRAEARRGARLPLAPTDRSGDPLDIDLGPVDISEQAVAAVVRYAADTVDGVRARSCRVTTDTADPRTLTIALSVSLRYGSGPVQDQIAAVRSRVAVAVEGQVGARAAGIDLTIVDLWPVPAEDA